jgi:transcriptional regulator with XRE-family HTH domain
VTKKALKTPVRTLGTPKDIGEAIHDARRLAGMSMVEMSKKIGISQAQVSRLEAGLQGFRTATMQKIAEALGVPVVVHFGPKKAALSLLAKVN